MAFVRAKKQGERVYHYLVTSERIGHRVRQKTVAYLGRYPSLDAALSGLASEIERHTREAARYREWVAVGAARIPEKYISGSGYYSRQTPVGQMMRRYKGGLLGVELHERLKREAEERLSRLKRVVV